MTWEPRTLRDRRQGGAPQRVRVATLPGEPVVEVEVPQDISAPVRCRCGRKVTPRMMIDTRGLPAEIAGGAEEVCDACWVRLETLGKVTLADLADAQDAPEADVAALAQRLGRKTPARTRDRSPPSD